uniref:HD/PDEase domain-containing protein n=1 Tax=Maylandia zebra TaxID=106582 RepID=A0A3P9DMV3_9CICH
MPLNLGVFICAAACWAPPCLFTSRDGAPSEVDSFPPESRPLCEQFPSLVKPGENPASADSRSAVSLTPWAGERGRTSLSSVSFLILPGNILIDTVYQKNSFLFFTQVFNDPIHGHIELPPLLVKIIDTPQFQRLRKIKQLGGGYYVFPGASHNRFEHSVGVGHLAGELVKALRAKQLEEPSLNSESLINDRDVLCVQIAGLCHDLGKSYTVFQYYMHYIEDVRWLHHHEDASILMFDHLVDDNKLTPVMNEYGLITEGDNENDLVFIKEMIKGSVKNNSPLNELYKGRNNEKSFLYEIVANKQNGIDVDKFDYFARDCHHLGIQNNFDHRRFIVFARVCNVDGQLHICSRDKEMANLYDMFHTRNSLHRRAYQHRVKMAVEIICLYMHFICSVCSVDEVIEQILHYGACSSTPSSLEEAAQIIQRIMCRDLYQLVGEIKVAKFDYGKNNEDPIRNYTYFYSKFNPTIGFKIKPEEVSNLLPECFSEKHIRVYWKRRNDKRLEDAKKCFIRFIAICSAPYLSSKYLARASSCLQVASYRPEAECVAYFLNTYQEDLLHLFNY